MSRECACGRKIPYSIVIDNKRRNLKNRTKCLNCLPFGDSNNATSQLSEVERKKKYLERKRKNTKDFYKRNKDKIEKISINRKQSLVNLIGGCQICGHSKPYNMAFHHVNESTKEFEIDRRKCQYSWSKVKPEILKCVMVCHNCHGDIHYENLNCSEIHRELIKLINPLENWPGNLPS